MPAECGPCSRVAPRCSRTKSSSTTIEADMHRAFFLLATLAAAQTSTPDSDVKLRQIWDDSFVKQRPAVTPRPASRPAGKPAASAASTPLGDAFVGVTLWNLRHSAPEDAPGSRLLVYDLERKRDEQLTPVRMDGDTPVAEGQKIRLSIESARTGYLYVVDREQ